jgi:hypothetical protein
MPVNTRFRNALAAGLRTVQDYAGEDVSYIRGSATATITAIRGDKTTIEGGVGEENTVQTTRVDWIVNAAELDIASGLIVPRESDMIIDTDGVKYRVTKHPNDGKCARWMEHRLAMRIHTLVVMGER